MKNWLGLAMIGVAMLASPARAQTDDQLIEGAKLCTQHLPRYEREFGIPTHLLSAIASTESGRYHEGLKLKLPWPWTINAAGKSYFYPTKIEAVAAAKKLLSHGVQSIDIGCMQVNVYHHPHAFSSIEAAFEPQNNIAYAASFLRDLYEQEGSWKKAAGDYHSKTPHLGGEYVNQVYSSWYQIIDRLREAKMQTGQTTLAMNEAPAQASRKPIYQAPHSRVVEASGQPHRKNAPIVVAAADTLPAITVVESKPAKTPGPGAELIRVNAQAPTETAAARKSGPNFVFND